MLLTILINFLIFDSVASYGVGHPQVNTNLPRFQSLVQLGEPAFSWTQFTYNLQGTDILQNPGNQQFTTSIRDDEFIQYNNVPMGVSRWQNRLYITMPRRRVGIPSTLNVLEVDEENVMLNMNLPLTPYPDLEANRLKQFSRSSLQLVSVYRTTVDQCNRIWMVDTGFLEYPGNQHHIQPAAIAVFNLLTNQLVHRYVLPSSVVTNSSNLAAISIDIPILGLCNNAFAYIPDVAGYGIIVYDMRNQRSWRFSHNYFHQDPNGGIFQINDLRFEWDDGVFSIALGPSLRHGFRTAYFHAMASTHEYSVDTRVLRNESYASVSYMANVYVHLGNKGPRQQSAMSILDQETGVLFFSQVNIGGVACWNTNLPFNRENFVLLFQDNQRFIYPSDLTMDFDGNLWIMTNTMPYFIYSRINPRSVNYRVWRFNVRELIANTKCDVRI